MTIAENVKAVWSGAFYKSELDRTINWEWKEIIQ